MREGLYGWVMVVAVGLLLVGVSPFCFKSQMAYKVGITGLDISFDNLTMVTVDGGSKNVNFWNLNSMNIIATYSNISGGNTATTAKFSKDGTLVAVGTSNGKIYILNGSTYSYIRDFSFSTSNSIVQVDFSWNIPTNDLLICGNDFGVYSSGGTRRWGDNVGASQGCKFNKLDDVGVIHNPKQVRWYPSGNSTRRWEDNKAINNDVEFSPATTLTSIKLLIAQTNLGYQYDSTGSSSASIISNFSTSAINVVCYSKDGNYFAYAGANSLIYLHNGTNSNNSVIQIFRDPLQSGSVLTACRFSYDNNYLAVGSSSGYIFIYTTFCANAVCRQGYYASGGSCLACSLTCATCAGAAATCTSCYSGYYLNGVVCSVCTGMANCRDCRSATYCLDCQSGYYLQANNTCRSCELVTAGCVSCFKNYTSGSNFTCSHCYTEYYLNATDSLCYSCNANNSKCVRCYNTSACLECESGHYISSWVCTACSTNCLVCNGSAFCLQCVRGYYTNSSVSNVCTVCPLNCGDCYSNSSCLSCVNGTYNNAGVCTACPATCLTCNATSYCFACRQNYYLSGGTCTACTNECLTCNGTSLCLSCNLGYYLSATNSCLPCVVTFPLCSSCNVTQCFSCLTGFSLNSTFSCAACSLTLQGCSACQSPTVCVGCLLGFYLSGSSCSVCPNNCTSCVNSTLCVNCAVGFYLNGLVCTSCPYPCLSCSPAATCNSCLVGHYFDSSSTPNFCPLCSAAMAGCVACASGTVCWECSVGLSLAAGNGSCLQCGSNCTSCNLTTCLSCSVGFYLSGGSCLLCGQNCSQCVSAANCTGCNTGYFFNSTLTSNQCSSCLSLGCTTCSSGGCFTCQWGRYLNATACPTCTSKYPNCLACNTTSCEHCDYGYYLNGASCSLCNGTEGCLACWSATNCSECALGYYPLANGSCSSCPSQCSTCVGGVCSSCTPRFTLNSLSTDCLRCDFYLLGCEFCASNSSCTNCVEGYYISGSVCLHCEDVMVGCLACSNSSFCLTCQGEYYYNGSACVSCLNVVGCAFCGSATNCTACQNGYYLANASCFLCQVSLPGCLYCWDISTCRFCRRGYYLNNVTGQCGLCIDSMAGCIDCQSATQCQQCDAGYYLNSTLLACRACNQVGCQICAENAPSTCLSCSLGFYLSGVSCLSCGQVGCLDCFNSTTCSLCDSGYYLSGGLCVSCSTNMTACSRCLSSSACSECHSLFFLNSSALCSLCSQSISYCATCLNGSSCATCVSGYYQSSGACVSCSTVTGCFMCSSSTACQSCVAGYYLSGSSCLSCAVISHCFECSNSTICANCQSGYMLNPNSACEVIKVEGTAADPIPELSVKTFFVNSSCLRHELMVKQGYTFKQAPANLSLTAATKISLYNSAKAAQIILTILSVDWPKSAKTVVFYTNNPVTVDKSTFDMPLVRLLLSQDDFALNYQTNFAMTKEALAEILPGLVFTNDFSLAQPLFQPAFYQSLLQDSGENYFLIFGIVIAGTLLVNSLIRATCTCPHSRDQGEIIPHLLSLKTIALMVFPLYPQVVHFCTGLMSADLPWLSPYYAPSLASSSDLSPLGFQLYFLNLNIASTYLGGLVVFLVLLLIGYLSITRRRQEKASKNQDQFSEELRGMGHENAGSYAYLKAVFNYFSFGIVFAGAISLQGALYNPLDVLSVNGFFYMLGTAIYFLMLGFSILLTTKGMGSGPIRSFLKATILSVAHISPIYIASLAVLLDLAIIIGDFIKNREGKTYPRWWLFNNCLANLSLLSLYYFSSVKLALFSSVGLAFLVVLIEILIHIDEGSLSKRPVKSTTSYHKQKNDTKHDTIDFMQGLEKEGEVGLGNLNETKTTFKDTLQGFNNTSYSKINEGDSNLQKKEMKVGRVNRRNRRFNNSNLKVQSIIEDDLDGTIQAD